MLTDAPLQELLAFSHAVTEEHAPGHFDLCSICNVKSGRCSEDCHWCAQSRRYATEVAEYGVLAPEAVCAQAKAQHAYGVGRFALVASGRRQTGADFMRLLDVYAALGELEGLKLCASLGLCTKEQLQDLKAAGVKRIHCNLETAPSFFPQICSTHGIEEKIRVIKDAQSLGLENLTARCVRVETLPERYDYVVSRAVTAMPEFVGWIWSKIDRGQRGTLPNGILYLKGGDLAEELARTGKRWDLYDIRTFFDEEFFETKKVVYTPKK